MDTGSCGPPKDPAVVRPAYDPNVTMLPPAPCYLVGSMELVYVYFGMGFVFPFLALVYVQFAWLKRFIKRKVLEHNLICKRPDDSDDETDSSRDETLRKSGTDRVKLLVAARARQSRFSILVTQAASPQTYLGQTLMSIAAVASATSLAIYLSSVSFPIVSVEFCGTMPNIHQPMDFVANMYLLFYFIIRLMGNEKKIHIIARSMHSIVDYLTIPAVVLSVILDRYFTGFAFFRAYNALWLVDILSNRGIIRNANTIRLVHLLLLVTSVLMISSGFLHLVENMGDPWLLAQKGTYNGQSISYWRCFLYLYGRVTLLDLSGMRIQTMLGRIIIYGFQILALGIVSKAIPQIILLLRIVPEYDKSYRPPVTSVHLILTGHAKASSVARFLKEFYNKDRHMSEFFKIVVLDEREPDEDMNRLLETYFNKLDYRRGSCLKLKDLNRVKVLDAEAVLILADRIAPDSDAEDSANIMRVVAIKNYRPTARVIIQVLQYHNKAYLQNIPSWSPKHGDIVICISELSLGLLAQSCFAPGFSTLMANFFTTRAFDKKTKYSEPWMADYVHGTCLEMYSRPFSAAFFGMDFTQACQFCYQRLKIVLIAIQANSRDPNSNPHINPPSTVLIKEGSCGYFIADNTQEVDSPVRMSLVDVSDQGAQAGPEVVSTSSPEATYDSTGMFHWKTPVPISEVVLTRQEAALSVFKNHIVLCILSQPNSQTIGLANIVLPLRSSAIPPNQLNEIVILGDIKFLEKEWNYLHNVPKLHVVKGTALNRSDLRAVNLNTCKMCVILGAPNVNDKTSAADPTFIDKAVILATLNVRAMRFSPNEIRSMELDEDNPRKLAFSWSTKTKGRDCGYEVPVISDLMRDSNVQFLEQDDEDVPGTEFYLTQPYAGGRAFAASVLDLLMITSFFNPHIVKVFHTMIFGGASLELELLLAEGAGLIGGVGISKSADTTAQVTTLQLSLNSGPLAIHAGSSYGGLFLDALLSLGLVVVGVFRLVNRDNESSDYRRYVVCNPPSNFKLHQTDQIYALRRHDWQPPSSRSAAPLQSARVDAF